MEPIILPKDASRWEVRQALKAFEEQQRAADAERNRRAAIVTGKVQEEPKVVSDLPELRFSEYVAAIPTLGGIFADLPLSARTLRRFPESVCLPVTLAAEQTESWVVVEWQGRGVAMTIDEAYERGLREAPNWVPNLDGVSAVPGINEIAQKLGEV